MTLPKTRSRFLPTLTEVVRPGSLSRDDVRVPVVNPATTTAQNSRALFALQQELSHALQEQLHTLLNAQIQQMLPQLHESIDAAVQEAVAKAIVARVAASD